MQAAWVQIAQWAAICGFLPFMELDPVAALHFERLSVLQLSIRATSWRRILGAKSDLGILGSVHVDEDAFRTACTQALRSRQIPVPELFLQWGDLGQSEAIALGASPIGGSKDRRLLAVRDGWSSLRPYGRCPVCNPV